MKMVLTVAALVLSATVSYAQDITGTWQGTLSVSGKELRLVFQISKGEGGAFRAVGYSIDQGGQAIPVSVTQDGANVKIAIVAIGGSYEGRFAADGNSITGTFAQGGPPTALILRRATPDTAWAIPNAPVPPKPMPADANPVFELSTIKPSDPNRPGKALTVRGREFLTINTSVSDLMLFAYGVHPRQLVGAPAWVEKELWDITARPDIEGQPNERQLRSMLQKLLVERFQLTFHREPREMPAYVLVVAGGGPKLNKSGGDPNGLPGLFFKGMGVLPAINATMADFTGVLQAVVLDRPVVDKTGLTGRWDFTLQWTPDDSQFGGRGGQVPAPAPGVNAPPGLFTAIQEQLGLRLESQRTPVDALVIDKVEKPSAN
jgi:uncharacterized protein (TIGR03435 family)